ncbi:MAG TPA: ribbon-helix-helix protein, CopG family [Gammaproteobacteria bacterium]|nr:ribbon-helix-helix protein, CopG family [Gammaproteobacteria bacterium]
MERIQINVRIPPELADRLDTKRIELKEKIGKIPSRSEVVRMALDAYLDPERKDS